MTNIFENIPTLFSTSDPRYSILILLLLIIALILRNKKIWLSNKLKSFVDNTNDFDLLSNTIIIVAGLVVSIFIFDFIFISTHHEKLGVMGDFFGGIVNPILTFLTFSGLLITIIMQRESALRSDEAHNDNKKQLNIHALEVTFFSMIELHHKIVESIRININYIDSIDPKNDENHIAFKESLGRLLHNKYKRLTDIESDGVPFVGVYTQNIEGRAALKAILSWITEDDNAITSKNKYIFIQKNANGILGHYFRNLYQIIKLIDDHPDLNKSQRKKYSNIARAQLSQEELCLLLLNCLEDVVDDGSFADLLIKWEILEHIQLQKDPTKEIWKIKQGGAICTTSDITHYKSKKPTEKSTYTPRGAFGKNPDIG